MHSALPEEIQPYKNYLQAGAFFPDSYYNCFGLSDAAEDAHWPPFLATAVKYFHSKQKQQQQSQPLEYQNSLEFFKPNKVKEVYLATLNNKYKLKSNGTISNNGKEDLLKFKAFIYGVFTHQIADSTWHSIRLKDGLLKHLAAMEFDNDIDSAHSFLDTGADFLLLKKLSSNKASSVLDPDQQLQEYYLREWQVPTEDLVNIYHSLGFDRVNNNNMNHCMNRGFAALNLELRSYKLSSLAYLQESPYLNDILDDYYLGGLEEIELSILRCIDNLNAWFDGKIDLESVDPWSLCSAKIIKPSSESRTAAASLRDSEAISQVLQQDNTDPVSATVKVKVQVEGDKNKGYFISPMIPNSRFGKDIAIGSFLGADQGICIAVGAPLEEIDGSIYVIPVADLAVQNSDSSNFKIKANSPPLITNAVKIKLPKKESVKTQKREKDNTSSKAAEGANGANSSKYGYKIKNFFFEIQQGNDSNTTVKYELIAVTSPGASTIQVFQKSQSLLTIDFSDDVHDLQQMGLLFDLADVNGDGILDFIVSSPFVDYHDQENGNENAKGKRDEKRPIDQNGAVVVLDGKAILLKILSSGVGRNLFSQAVLDQFNVTGFSGSSSSSSSSSSVVNYKDLNPKILTIPDELKLSDGFENFGSTISASSEFLYVGVTSISSVLAYETKAIFNNSNKMDQKSPVKPSFILPHGGGEPLLFYDIQAASSLSSKITRIKSKYSGQFGTKFLLSGHDATLDLDWVLVAAHSETVGSCIKCGSLYLYVIDNPSQNSNDVSTKDDEGRRKTTAKLINKIILKTTSFSYDFGYSKFGFNGIAKFNDRPNEKSTTVYISSPRLNSSGALWKFDLTKLLSSAVEDNNVSGDSKINNSKDFVVEIDDAVIEGIGETYSGFGVTLGYYDDKLVVGMPDYGYGELSDDNDKVKLTGRIGIYDA